MFLLTGFGLADPRGMAEAMLPGGALASPREAGVPLLAALGGMMGPAGLYAIQVSLAGTSSFTGSLRLMRRTTT